ncbi:MAG: tyrosine-type recombinase/integrase, partial [Bacteroidota bacterium]
LRFSGKRLVYSTSHSIHPKDWDFTLQRPIQQTGRPDLFQIKRCLDDFASHCLHILVSDENHPLSPTQFRAQLDLAIGGSSPNAGLNRKRISFLDFLDAMLKEMIAEHGLEANTTKAYALHLRNLQKFAQEVRPFDYEDVDWEFRLELIDYLASKGHKLSYGNKTLNKLRQFLELARKKKLHNNTAYLGAGWSVPRKKAAGEKVILTSKELSKLAELQFEGQKQKALDLFLLGAGTGQRFSDYSRYTPNNFYTTARGITILTLVTQKTKTLATVPINLFPWVKLILERYNYYSPTLSMQKLNVLIKEICEQAGINQSVFLVEQFIGRKAIVKKRHVPKFQEVSSHTCRRSFATNLYRMGFSLAQIMPMTGHSTESQLREYIGIDGEMNAEEIALSIIARRQQSTSDGAIIKALGA